MSPLCESGHLVLLVEVDEGERQGDVERVFLEGTGCAFAGLEGDHQVDVAGRPLLFEGVHEVVAEDLLQQLFKLHVDTWQNQ